MRQAPNRPPLRHRFLGRVCSEREGASATEFALVVPVLVLMVGGIIEMSILFFVNVLAEGGLREAARFGITGQGAGEGQREGEHLITVEIFFDYEPLFFAGLFDGGVLWHHAYRRSRLGALSTIN